MGSYVASGCTGAGSVGIGGNFQILYFAINLVTPGPLTDLIGGLDNERVHHAGMVGLGTDNGGPPNDYMSVFKFVSVKRETMIFDNQYQYLDTIYWDLDQGVVVDLAVYW